MTRLDRVRAAAASAEREVVAAASRVAVLADAVEAAQRRIEACRGARELNVAAKAVLEQVSSQEATEAQEAVATLVSRGLREVFGEEYSFVVEDRIVRGNSHLDFVIKDSGGNCLDPVDSHGGGLAAVTAFLLRVVVVLLEGGRTLVVDEAFAHLSREYVPRLAAFLRTLVDTVGLQLILVSHVPELAETADRAYRFVPHDGQVKVVELTA